MTIVDETVVSVALPSIQRDLGFATSDLSWVVNAYLASFGGLLLLSGRIGDLVGRRRVLLGGLTLFVVASALCGVAGSPAWLVAARFLQGAGGALAASVALGMVVSLFDDPGLQARAIGIYSFVGAAGASSGSSSAASSRTSSTGAGSSSSTSRSASRPCSRAAACWPSSAAPGCARAPMPRARSCSWRVDARDRRDRGRRRARPGGRRGGLLGAVRRRQATARRPLLPLGILRARIVAGANVVHALTVAAMFGFQFLVTLYFQQVLGYSPRRRASPCCRSRWGSARCRWSCSRGSSAGSAPGGAAAGAPRIAAGLALLARAPVDGRYLADVAPSVALFAVGAGLVLPGS